MPENIHTKKLGRSEMEITGEIPVAELEKEREGALAKLGAHIEIPGFRKGHVPANILKEKISEANMLHEMAERALKKAYPHIMREHGTEAIGTPQIAITKLAPGNPVEFKITLATMPEIPLPDYITLAKNAIEKTETNERVSVTDEEVEKTIEALLKNIPKEGDAEPKLTDELVKKFGDFKTVEDFKEKIRTGIIEEKKRKEKEKVRSAILESILSETHIELPDIIVASELDKMIAQFKGDIERVGQNPKDYFEKIGKTEEDMRREWRTDAEKRAKAQLILNKIALEEKILPDEETVKRETDHILSHHPNADREHAEIYVRTVLANEKVLEFLENQKEKVE